MHTMLSYRGLVSLLIVVCALALPARGFADSSSQLTVTPVVIDEKAKPRDIVKETISITNTTDHKLSLYPSVNNIERVDGEQPFAPAQGSGDLSDSLANWIELSRGVIDLSPGEQRDVPFIIHVNFNAVPGSYHAQIAFTSGSTRQDAEAAGPLATITVNVEVQDDVKEILQLDRFSTGKFFLAGDDVRFDYNLENIGNQELQPRGEIRVYDRRGVEVASVDVNKEGKAVSPEQMAQLASVWDGATGFGQYKALLTVYYGRSQTASVQDTVFFWIVPWKQLIGLFLAGLVGVIFFAFYVHRKLEERHGLVPVVASAHDLAGVSSESVHQPKPRRAWSFSTLAAPLHVVAGAVGSVRRLKRGERTLRPQPVVQESVVQEPATPVPASQPVMQQPVVPPPVPAQSGTIDLKNLRTAAPEHVVSDAHVIDLKKL